MMKQLEDSCKAKKRPNILLHKSKPLGWSALIKHLAACDKCTTNFINQNSVPITDADLCAEAKVLFERMRIDPPSDK